MFEKKGKKYAKGAMSMAVGGIALGASAGISSNAYVNQGISGLAKAYPKAGSIMGAGMVMDSLGGLQKSMKKMKY